MASKLESLSKWLDKYRPWIYKKAFKNEINNNFLIRKNQFNFSLMSYNILSEELMHKHIYLYSLCSPKMIKWPDRGLRILNEIEINNPDILCLQELYLEHYTDFYKYELKKKGYDSIYHLRTFKSDGCVLFFKENKFNLIKSKEVNYYREDLMEILDRPNVGLIAMFEPIENQNNKIDNRLIVGTTHLLFNLKRGDIKLAQIRLLLAEIERMALHKIDENGIKHYYPFIIAGDFNLLPFSPIHQFLERGILDWRNLDSYTLSGHIKSYRKSMSADKIDIKTITCDTVFLDDETDKNKDNKEEDSRMKDSNQIISHNFNLKSVFNAMNMNNQKFITTRHDQACEMVDYIFYHQTPELDLIGFRKLLDEEKIFSQVHYMPNSILGSDHFSLIAKFSLLNKKF